MRGWLSAIWALPLGVVACSGSDSGTEAAPSGCAPGKQVACACWDGSQGVQTCAADGRSFGECGSCPGTGGSGGFGGSGGSASGGTAGSGGTGPPPPPEGEVDLVADVNRSGALEPDDPSEFGYEETWDQGHGAVLVANIDDDLQACPSSGDDVTLPQCFDAADDAVNGPDDLLDMAPLAVRAWPGAPDGATAQLEIGPASAPVRLFRESGGSWTAFDAASGSFSTDELRAGVSLALEARDVVRNAAVWDGFVDVTLVADTGGAELARDAVRLRVSPVVLHHHLMQAETIHVTHAFGNGLSDQFVSDLGQAVAASGVPNPLDEIAESDIWTEDFFESGFMSMPGPNGSEHVVRVYIRSANTRRPDPLLRSAGQVVFTHFRGKDVAGLQEWDETRGSGGPDTLDSFGNTETIPPFTNGADGYPLGRMLRGGTASYHPDADLQTLFDAQKVQPLVLIDTTWLSVGHVDETLSFVKASTPRGWVLLANDAALARQMLEQQQAAGNGWAPVNSGTDWERSIDDVLSDPDVMGASAEAAAAVDAQIAILKQATGLADDEIVPVPFLHHAPYGLSVAYQPATVNGVYLADAHWGSPDPHGPVINGQDIFKMQHEASMGALGISVHWLEDFYLYHTSNGEVHCGTNSTRTTGAVRWWVSGR